jgi:hypothetical protein
MVAEEGQSHRLFKAEGYLAVCDYSLHLVASRPAKAGDKLETTSFHGTTTRGFAAVGEPNVAVCLLPGTEIAFEQEVEYRRGLGFFMTGKVRAKTARFRQVNNATPTMHHDALEFPDGQTVLLTRLCDGQRATVLQLPAASRVGSKAEEQKSAELSLPWSMLRGGTRYRLSVE